MQRTADRHAQRIIDLYFGLMLFLLGIIASLAAIPILFFLKDRLHLGPEGSALFTAITSVPLYLSFLLGYLRDRWRPRPWGDRTYILGSALLAALAFVSLTGGEIGYGRLLGTLLCTALLGQMAITVMQALSTTVAQRRKTTGQLSAVYMLAFNAPIVVSSLAGGWLSAHLSPRAIFGVVAAGYLLTALLALWRPAPVFDTVDDALEDAARVSPTEKRHALDDIRRLLGHRAVWPAILLFGMWNFGLCFNTPLFFYLTEKVHLTDQQFGNWNALFSGCFLPTTALYGPLSRRWPLRPLLWVGTVLATIQVIPFAFMHTVPVAYAAAVFAGLCGGLVNGALLDLLMRSAPRGLEGTAVTAGFGMSNLAALVSGLAGAALYARGGFVPAVVGTSIVYFLMLPVLLLIPRETTATHDADSDAEAAA